MDAFAIGFAVFGALVCASALVTEHRQRASADADGAIFSRRQELDYLRPSPSSFFVARAGTMLDEASRRRGHVDIHGVEAESDLEESDGAASNNGEGVDDALRK
jgi:hypothetical protein